MKSIILLKYMASAFVLSLSLAALSVQAADKPASASREKVVLQVSDADPQKWNLVLNNAKNVRESLGAGNVDIEIVAYGPGIEMLKFDSEVGNRVDQGVESGIRVVACEKTMHAQKLTQKDMLPSISYVPSGVVELMRKQKEGYAYIRP